MLWNDPKRTLPMASYERIPLGDTAERRLLIERRNEERRAALGERRLSTKRVLRALLRM